MPNLINTDETLEFACIVKAICDNCEVHPDELRIYPPADHLLVLTSKVRFKKQIPIKIPIHSSITPNGASQYLSWLQVRSAAENPYHSRYASRDDGQITRLAVGLGEFELRLENYPDKNNQDTIQFWIWNGAQDYYMYGGSRTYLVKQKDVFKFTNFVKRLQRTTHRHVETPILPTEMLNEVYNNSIGFLLKGREMQAKYKKYKIPYKRGILLSGRPGCGKTLTCRWLRELCEQNNFTYRVVTMEDYKEAAHRGRVRQLFKLHGKRSGIIFFDDMDVMVKDRKKADTTELSTFLAELDGLDPAEGVIYVFTTNYIQDLDEAFVRPGRIDLWLPYHLPTSKLRQKFVEQKFDDDIKKFIKIDDIVKRTKEYSFAEIEEVRKLFCLDIIDDKAINVAKTFATFNKHRKDFEQRAIMGFGSLEDSENEEVYEDEGYPIPPPARRWG